MVRKRFNFFILLMLSSPCILSADNLIMIITERIEINPKVMLGKPVIRGTRITVELLLRKLSEGASEGDLLDAYPRLTKEDIHAAIRYAADSLAHEEIVPLSQPKRKTRK
jgi:uncharacterized protein (DUF433 family)